MLRHYAVALSALLRMGWMEAKDILRTAFGGRDGLYDVLFWVSAVVLASMLALTACMDPDIRF